MPFWTFCKSLLKIQHLFSLLGNQSLLFIGCAIQQNTPADIRYSFLFAELPRTEDAIHPPAAWVRIAASMS
jgi:hypothetical protein